MLNSNKKNANNEESLWEQIEQQIKFWLHSLAHELLENQVSTPIVFHVLVIIETLQFNYYSIHPLLNTYIWDTKFIDFYRDILQYFQVNFILKESSEEIFLTILYVSFSVNLVITGLVVFTIHKIITNQKKTSSIYPYVVKLLSLLALFMNTILSMPAINSFLSTFICNNDSAYTRNQNCYSGIYFLHIIIGLMGMIMVVSFSLIFSYLLIDMNPASTISFAQPQSLMPLLKLGLKFLSPFYVTIDYDGKFALQYIVMLTVFNIVILFYRFLTPPFYNKYSQNLVIFCESFLFWVSFCSLITTFLEQGTSNDIGIFYLALCLPMLCHVYRTIFQYRMSLFVHKSIKEFENDQDAEMFVIILIDLIENRTDPHNRIKLEGILKYHSKSCPNDTCYCKELILDETSDEDENQVTHKWFLFLQSILEDSLEKYVKSARLHLLHSYVQHEKLKNKFKALFELMIARENKPNIQEEFSIFRFSNQIEVEIKENDEKGGDSKAVDVNKIVSFQKKFMKFQAIIDKSVQLHLDFWHELMEENPEIQKIENLGSKITSTVEQVREQFGELHEIYSNHIKCLEIYGYFLMDIVNDDAEGEKIIESAKYAKNSLNANRQFVDSDRLKYGENSNTAVLTVSGNYEEIGTVTNLNSELQRILGWTKADIVDQNVQRIMPKVIADLHDKLMENFLHSSQGKVIGRERLMMCLHKNQYIVPCTLMVKVLPNLEEGISIVGFIKDIEDGEMIDEVGNNMSHSNDQEKVHYMVYRTDNEIYSMQGITESCFNQYGIPASLMFGNNTGTVDFTVDFICPELVNPDHYDELKSQAGFKCTLDSTAIQSNFLMDEDESDEEEGELQHEQNSLNDDEEDEDEEKASKLGKKKKYKKVEIRAQIIEELSFEDRKVCVLKFVEVSETDDGKDQDILDQRKQQNHENNENGNEKKRNKYKEEHEDGSEEKESNLSSQSLNEEIRQLKDFKSLIAEKTVSKSIIILSRTVIALIIIIFTLASTELGLKIGEDNSVMSGVDSIYTAFQRTQIMADVNFYVRRVSNIANDIRLPVNGKTKNDEFLSNQNSLAENVNLLQTSQFANMKDIINLGSGTSSLVSSALYDVKYQQQTRSDIKVYSSLLTDAMIQLITSASSLSNSTMTSFVDNPSSTYVDSSIKNFFFVVTNGLFVLRSGTEFESDQIYQYYYDNLDPHELEFKIIMALAIGFLALSLIILIPYVFKVHKTNNRVLSLFGKISLNEIKELVARCEVYSIKFIDDKKKDDEGSSKQEEDEEGESDPDNNQNVSQPLTRKSNKKLFTKGEKKGNQSNLEIDGENNHEDVKIIEAEPNQKDKAKKVNDQSQLAAPPQNGQMASAIKNQQLHGSNVSISSLPDTLPSIANGKNLKKGDPNKKEKDEEEEVEIGRIQKLMNSKDNNAKKVVIQFGFFALIFVVYFVVGFVLELQFLENMRSVLQHQDQVSQRCSIIKYILVYMVEQISIDKVQLQDGENMLTSFINKSYLIENEINSSSLKTYPSQFDTYFTAFQKANYDNFCEIFPSTETLTSSACSNINSSMLEKGLKVSITAYVEDIRNMITDYLAAGDQTKSAKTSLFGKNKYTDLEQMQFYMVPMIQELNSKLSSGIQEYLNNQDIKEEIKYVTFLIVLIIVFVGVWLPYLEQLSQKIWRTKGMLNMIPMDIITRDPNLKQAFVSGDILQAIK